MELGPRRRVRHDCKLFFRDFSMHGTLFSSQPRLVDELNATTATRLVVQTVWREAKHALPEQNVVGCASIGISSLLFIARIEQATGTVSQNQTAWVRQQTHHVRIRSGPYEIAGCLQLPDGAQPATFLQDSADRFLVVSAAMVTRDGIPNEPERYQVLIVNREHAEFAPSSLLTQEGRLENQA